MTIFLADSVKQVAYYVYKNPQGSQVSREEIWTCREEIQGKIVSQNDSFVVLTKNPELIRDFIPCLVGRHQWLASLLSDYLKLIESKQEHESQGNNQSVADREQCTT